MKITRRSVLNIVAAAAAAGTLPSQPARAADKKLTIGVCSDFSGVYSDIGGETSFARVRQALQDFGAANKGYDITVIQGDHQNKPDVGAGLARQWFERRRRSADRRAQFRRRAGDRGCRRGKEQDLYQFQRRDLAADRREMQRADHPLDLRHLHAVALHRRRDGGRGGKKWFFITANYAFGQCCATRPKRW